MASRETRFLSFSVPVTEVHDSASVVIIVTTEDKLRILLNSYERVQDKRRPWLPVLSLFVTLVAARITSVSNDFLLPKEAWPATFGGAAIAALIWFFGSAKQAFWAWIHPMSIDDVVRKLKEDSQSIVSAGAKAVGRQGDEVAKASIAKIGEGQDD